MNKAKINRTQGKLLNIPIGTPVEISFVPAPVINVELYATGVVISKVEKVGMVRQVSVQLDDGRLIKWNIDYLAII
ncbi:hypothetical protein [Crocosphaera chwakensis]|uniref:Uncharacterized protein n=1 Tax=Crocosphaera chwakensis CCY0110 TaxID=391612 RepID=A3IYY2_9CHRO|nr:hypothetical protein [Crocosphaera chwakensis]EAZ88322.1 hypothetical protein CY0110_14850 [Crocosphaera chwakensis CCY0110]